VSSPADVVPSTGPDPCCSEPTIPFRNPPLPYRADLVLDGPLDIADEADVVAAFDDLVTVLPTVTVDLSRVTFMDCAGVNILLRAHATAVAAGSRLDLVAVSYAAWRMIQVGRLLRPYPEGALRLPAAVA
jgi:anti-anti-sigma factor